MAALIENITVGALIQRAVANYPHRPAIEYGQRVWSYSRMDGETDLLAKGFLASGIRKGTHVALWADNHPNTLLCVYALLKIGAVPVFLGGCSTGEELMVRMEDGECTFFLFSEQVRGISAADLSASGGMPDAAISLYIGEGEHPLIPGLNHILKEGESVSEEALAQAKAAVSAHDPDSLLFTSGSSGRPKGVLLTHYARANNAIALAEALAVTEEDKFCCALPLFHCFAYTANAICALAAGACLCFPEGGRTAAILRAIHEKRCTIFMGVPTMFSTILSRKDLGSYDLSSLRTGLMAGSTYPPVLFEQARQRLNYQLLPAYGLTEGTGGVTCGSFSDPEWLCARSVGKPLPHLEFQLWDGERQQPSAPGEAGEIRIRGFCIMEGYYPCRGQAVDSELDEEGWFATGDMGRMDEEGNLYIVGRLKELIIRGGENISAVEVENLILSDTRIAEVKAVGVPDPHYMEEVCVCVVAASPIREEEVQEVARAHGGPRKVPRYVIFFEGFPRTVTGKIDTAALRRMAMAKLGIVMPDGRLQTEQ